jgi:hypothetical protein
MFVPGKPFQPSLMLADKTGAYKVKDLSGAPLYGRFLASPTNIRLGWKGLPWTNTLAYYENLLITTVKSFIVQAILC